MVFYWRCSSMVNSCIHTPTLKASLSRLYAGDAPSTEDEIALVLMALAMAVQFTPRGSGGSDVDDSFRVRRMGEDMTPVERRQALHQLATSILKRRVFESDATLEQLQACIIVNVFDLDSDDFKSQMLFRAARCAEILEADRITASDPVTIENEMKVRAW